MPNYKSAEKRLRQNIKKRQRNRTARSTVRTSIKKVQNAVEAGELDKARQYLLVAERRIAKAVTKGLYHKKNGSRKISRLASLVNRAADGSQAASA